MGWVEVSRILDSAREELQEKEKLLLEEKAAFIEEVRRLLPEAIDRAISEIVAANASRVDELPVDQLRNMKSALAVEKNKAVEKGISALQSADWLWRGSSGKESGKDPIGFFGVNEEGEIWQSLQNYSKDMEAILKAYGLEFEKRIATHSYSRFRVGLAKTSDGRKEELQEINEAVGKAHVEYCTCKNQVISLERELKETVARERYESLMGNV